MPPSSTWLMSRMEAEWCSTEFQGADFWSYATQPVPLDEEGRKYPNPKGGFDVRDQGLHLPQPLPQPQPQSGPSLHQWHPGDCVNTRPGGGGGCLIFPLNLGKVQVPRGDGSS